MLDDGTQLPLYEPFTRGRVQRLLGKELHTHARIDIPLFPGAGATFRPAQVQVTASA